MGRIERRSRPIAGMGGCLRIGRRTLDESGDYLALTMLQGLLDVAQWQVRQKRILADVTHSGSLGAVKRAVVGFDFEFTCACPWNARMGTKTATMPGSLDGVLLGFLQEVLTGDASVEYSVGMEFFLGDPLNYVSVNGVYVPEDVAFYAAEEVIVEEFNTICDARGRDVVRLDFMGWGNSLLHGYRGVAPMEPELKFAG